MSAAPANPAPAKLIVGMLAGRRGLLDAAAEGLAADRGPVDLRSEVWAFDFTDYYAEQMGEGLLRQFVGFERLICPSELVAIKRATNALEAAFAAERGTGAAPPRPLNLDPGYDTESKLVLASAKDFAHRVYLGEGIHAEVTLTYVRGAWRSGPHTFPDYASGLYDGFLTEARDRLRRQLRAKEPRP